MDQKVIPPTGNSPISARMTAVALELIAREDVEQLVPELHRLSEAMTVPWESAVPAVLNALHNAHPRFLTPLVLALAEQRRELGATVGQIFESLSMDLMSLNLRSLDENFWTGLPNDPTIRRWAGIVVLLDRLQNEIGADDDRYITPATLVTLGREECFFDSERLNRIVTTELDGGRVLPGTFIAMLRRSYLAFSKSKRGSQGAADAAVLKSLVDRFSDPVVNPGEEWADRILAELAEADADWRRLLSHAATATTSRPTKRWEKSARELIDRIGAREISDRLPEWLRLVGRPRTHQLVSIWSNSFSDPLSLDPYNVNALRGICWLISLLPTDPRTARALGRLAEAALYKVWGNAPLNPKVANTAVTSLGRIDSEAALAELARLSARVTYRGTLRLVREALDAKAAVLGITRAEVEEMAVPDFGLSVDSRAHHQMGGSTAIVEIDGTNALLRWQNAAGRTVKRPPAAVVRDCAGELDELRATVKSINIVLADQKKRLERLFLAQRTWTFDEWRERYLEHPLVGAFTRHLLWDIDETTVGYADGHLRTVVGDPVTGGAQVRLWHPLHRADDEILAWRDRLDNLGITQPFEQVRRAVYELTPAEFRTGYYSNRFAEHTLRQHRLHALATHRGWRNTLRLPVDDEAPPATRELPEWGLRAEYRIGSRYEEGDEYLASPSYRYVYGGQIRFYPIDAPVVTAHMLGGEYGMSAGVGVPVDPIPLDTVPTLVLSEIFRDVAMLVGGSTIVNDSAQVDNG